MKVKFGFLVEELRSLGITNPEDDFIFAKIKSWAKKPGEAVAQGDLIAEVETDKVTADLNSSWTGVISSVVYKIDEEWELGVTKGGDELSERSEGTPFGKILLPELGHIETGEEEKKSDFDRKKSDFEEEKRVRAAPAARKLAREAGVDINSVQGTGPFGRVMRVDVEAAIAERRKVTENLIEEKPAKPLHIGRSLPENIILLTPSREDLTIAHNLERGSGTVIAAGEPVWRDTFDEYNLSEIRAIRAEYKKEFEEEFGVPLHVSAPMILAAIRALRLKDFWIFNGFWHIEDENNRNKDNIALYTAVNMGISIDLGIPREIDLEKKTISGPRLRIATLHSANDLSLKEFFKQHHDLMNRAASDIRAKKLSQTTLRDWTGWTFIFNNVGAARHRRGNSLFTPNMSAMLNMGVIGRDGKTPFQIFFDHRLIDGVPATLFLDAVYTELIERVLPEIKMACAALRGE